MKALANKSVENSRVIFYFNFHGEISDINQNDESDNDELLVLWTEEKPFTTLSALSFKQWITAQELRGILDSVKADEIVIVIDACYAGEAVPSILKEHGRGGDWKGQEAVILSSKEGQVSHFTADGSEALFTMEFSKSISSAPDLQAAVHKAASETSVYIQDNDNQKKCIAINSDLANGKEPCEQTPFAYDPTGLLPAIELQSGSN